MIATILVGCALGVAGAAPASAQEATVVSTYNSSGQWVEVSDYQQQPGVPVYGSQYYYNIVIQTASGSAAIGTDAVTTLQQLDAGSSTWVTVAQATGPYLSGYTKALTSGTFRVTYSGNPNFAPTSADAPYQVQRKVTVQNKGVRRVLLVGKVAPTYHGKVLILKKAGKKWKTWKVLRTNKRSVFKTGLPAPRHGRYYWRAVIKPSGGFVATDSGIFYTYKR
ncbi:hypothetical protein GON03_02215 [Nocardioides sp. MAH-18]|uniref:Uncharacterized protein n=1 Tax=Nocardioides agri TaxID=2682843 RepID=A0A6L6XMK8_9ACTN|nr:MULTISPECIES: hypothetical protein [unclassified Nocardioides]MBA2953108.1 hypothetical protein [Nocardioides sp. CGMCC 1.13656]MVQ47977.1 hypothetical protein [Nocardioides sp. MAH-18]